MQCDTMGGTGPIWKAVARFQTSRSTTVMRSCWRRCSAQDSTLCEATPPHTALPTAIPPWNTSLDTARARARTKAGTVVCMATVPLGLQRGPIVHILEPQWFAE